MKDAALDVSLLLCWSTAGVVGFVATTVSCVVTRQDKSGEGGVCRGVDWGGGGARLRRRMLSGGSCYSGAPLRFEEGCFWGLGDTLEGRGNRNWIRSASVKGQKEYAV